MKSPASPAQSNPQSCISVPGALGEKTVEIIQRQFLFTTLRALPALARRKVGGDRYLEVLRADNVLEDAVAGMEHFEKAHVLDRSWLTSEVTP